MPNLFSALPVVILAWVRASTSGLTRMAMATVAPFDDAISEMRSSSGSDSTLKQRMPVSMASAISRAVLATPEKTILSGVAPAASARRSSPSETTSSPAPSWTKVRITDWLEFAFMA